MRHAAMTALLLAAVCAPAAAQTPVNTALLTEAEIIPDVIPAVSLDSKLNFDLAFPSGAIDAGNLFSIDASASAPMVSISCKPGAPTEAANPGPAHGRLKDCPELRHTFQQGR